MFFPSISVFPCQYHSTIAQYSFTHLPPTLYNVSPPVFQFSPVSITPPLLNTHLYLQVSPTRRITLKKSTLFRKLGSNKQKNNFAFYWNWSLKGLQKLQCHCVHDKCSSCGFIGYLPNDRAVPRLLGVVMQPAVQRSGAARTIPVTIITPYYRDHGWSYSVAPSNLQMKLLRQ